MTARLTITSALFTTLMNGLAERGQGHRESGAFLLTDRNHPAEQMPQPVTTIAFYDDLDPHCLTGGIDFHATGYTALQSLCRRERLRVIGDIHTHPASRVHQSRTDARHPMVALNGHVALIAPNFARDVPRVTQCGVHLRTDGAWSSFYGDRAAEIVFVAEAGRAMRRTPWWRRLLLRLIVRRKVRVTR